MAPETDTPETETGPRPGVVRRRYRVMLDEQIVTDLEDLAARSHLRASNLGAIMLTEAVVAARREAGL